MHPILEEFCDKWVWPTMPGAPGAEFRLKITREQCLKGWEILLERNIRDIDVLPVHGINVYDVLRRHTLVLTRAALEALEARFK